jgi:2-(1,2-epoxy-1,2-dihydrophenyl)acetyl-CoA isomerase
MSTEPAPPPESTPVHSGNATPAGPPPDGLRLTVDAGVAEIRLARPESGNSLTRPMVAWLADWFTAASDDRAVRVITLSADGDKFCTGPDLRVSLAPNTAALDPPRVSGEVARGTRNFWQRLVSSVLDCEKPVVCGLNGTAAGAGVSLALACDVVLAAESARLIEVFVRRGIAPDAGAAYLLTRLIGLQHAKRICFSGRPVGAAEAVRLGLVVDVVSDAELEETVHTLADELAGGPTAAIAAAKRLINHAPDVDRASAFWEEADVQEAVVTSSSDAQEGLRAFAERRPPAFRGF